MSQAAEYWMQEPIFIGSGLPTCLRQMVERELDEERLKRSELGTCSDSDPCAQFSKLSVKTGYV